MDEYCRFNRLPRQVFQEPASFSGTEHRKIRMLSVASGIGSQGFGTETVMLRNFSPPVWSPWM